MSKKCNVGGQAVIEGVMMRGAKGIATAVRVPSGDIKIDFIEKEPVNKKGIFSLPIIRGFIGLIDSMIVGIKTLNFSASFFEDDEEPSKFENWFRGVFGEKSNDVIMGITLIISLIFSLAIFAGLPTLITQPFKFLGVSSIGLNFIEGILRVLIFLIYIFLIGKVSDMKRLFQYHGAEHKTIFCYEQGLDLTVENVKKFQRFHPRCGTNFIFLVMIVSILMLSLTGWQSFWERMLTRFLMLPIIAGVTYELIRWLGKSTSSISTLVARPGLKLQKLTTEEPEEDQIEVAIYSLRRAEGLEKTIGNLLEEGNRILKNNDIDTYILDCQLILGKVIGKDKLYLITNRDEKVSVDKELEFLKLINKRKEKMPVKYILGKAEFMGLDFNVTEGVLIPRGDTEVLVEEALNIIKENDFKDICDLCCGSGAIGISLAVLEKGINITCIDIEEIPQEVTKENIGLHGVKDRVKFLKSNLLSEVIVKEEKFDLIASNPPYIKEDVIPTLMKDVRDYEPKVALSGGEDGLDFYKKIVNESLDVLKENGYLVFEIGHDQGIEVKTIMEQKGFTDVEVIKDLAGNDRVVKGRIIKFKS